MKPKKPMGGKRPGAGRKKRGLNAYMHLDPAVIRILQQLEDVLNEKLKAAGHRPLSRSEVLAVVVTDALVANAGDVQEESGAMGLHRLAVRLAPLFGADGLAASGLPELSDGEGARHFNRSHFQH